MLMFLWFIPLVWTISLPWERSPSMRPMIITLPRSLWKLTWNLSWVCPGPTLSTTAQRRSKWSLKDIDLQMESISRQTKSKTEQVFHLLYLHSCLTFFFFNNCRHVYVVDLFAHNVHVLDRKKDNSLVPVKVSDANEEQGLSVWLSKTKSLYLSKCHKQKF